MTDSMIPTSDTPAAGAPATDTLACPEITFESRLTEKGYRSVMLRVSLMRLRWIAPIAAFFIMSALGRGDTRTAVFLFGMTVFTVLIIVLYANWASGSPSQSSVYAPVTYRTGVEGLEYESDDRHGMVEWPTIRRWVFVDGHYLLYVGSASYVLVPAVALDDPELFETILRCHVAHGPRRKV